MPLIKKCSNCDNLKTLYKKVECTILYLLKKKHEIKAFNLKDTFDEERYSSLIRYKRILKRRLYSSYLPNITNANLVEIITPLAFRGENCDSCEKCFPDL